MDASNGFVRPSVGFPGILAWMAEPAERFWISRSRLETLVDGIFAIAMTLLILEIRVPELNEPKSASALLGAIAHLGPALFSYLLSFAMLGAFWYRHHRLLHMIRRVDVPLFAFTILFLVGATLFPFAAAVLGRYPVNPASAPIYAAPVAVLTIGLALQWEWAERHGLFATDIPALEARRMRRRARLAPVFVSVMFCLLAGRLTPWAYVPLLVLLPTLLWARLRTGGRVG